MPVLTTHSAGLSGLFAVARSARTLAILVAVGVGLIKGVATLTSIDWNPPSGSVATRAGKAAARPTSPVRFSGYHPPVCVLCIELMPADAMGFAGIDGLKRLTAQDIRPVIDWLHVLRIDACARAADMVKFVATWDRSHQHLVRNDVREPRPSINSALAIPIRSDRAKPWPAVLRSRAVDPEATLHNGFLDVPSHRTNLELPLSKATA